LRTTKYTLGVHHDDSIRQQTRIIGVGTVSTMVELGVYEGEFSAHCRRVLEPGRLTLIDHWDYSKYEFVLEEAPQSRHIRSIFKTYYGGDPDSALQAAYGKVLDRSHGDPSVEVLRLDIAEAAERFHAANRCRSSLSANEGVSAGGTAMRFSRSASRRKRYSFAAMVAMVSPAIMMLPM
jgi:hypothetical protein